MNEATLAARKIVAAAIAGAAPDGSPGPTTQDTLRLFRDQLNGAADPAARGRLETVLRRKLESIQAARLGLRERRSEIDGDTLATLTRELDLEEEQVRLALGDSGEVQAL